MPKIRPFKSFVYNENFRSKLGTLVSPPYDVITATELSKWRDLSPYQSVRLALAENNDDPDRYKKMSALFLQWKKENILTQVSQPSFYIIEDRYQEGPVEKTRLGFVGLLETVPHEKKEVLPHEHTLAGPKKDRFDLLHEMKAEISQIFLAYDDPTLVLESIFDQICQTNPLLECLDRTEVSRKVWALSDPALTQKLVQLLAGRPALIADGHHRYETAIASIPLCPWVQCYFTNLKNPQFSIHPIHRTFSLPHEMSFESFLKKMSEKFQTRPVEKIPDHFNFSDDASCIRLFVSTSDRHFELVRTKKNDDDAEIFSIHADILEGILGWNVKELSKGTIEYTHTHDDFLGSLQGPGNRVGLFLPPTSLDLVMRLAKRGEKMPQKSTFFYPKLASGLINFDLTDYS